MGIQHRAQRFAKMPNKLKTNSKKFKVPKVNGKQENGNSIKVMKIQMVPNNEERKPPKTTVYLPKHIK